MHELAGQGLRETADAARVQLPRLPGAQPLALLFREASRVGRRAERLAREAGHGLVVLAAARALERQGEDDVGSERAHDAHDVSERLLVAPLRERLFDAERIAELVGAAEILLDRVVPVKGQELACAQHAERVEQLRADGVLPAFTPRHREQGRVQAEAAGEAHQDAVVLVVRVGGDVEHPTARPDAPEREAEAVRATVEREGLERRLGRRECRDQHEDERDQRQPSEQFRHIFRF